MLAPSNALSLAVTFFSIANATALATAAITAIAVPVLLIGSGTAESLAGALGGDVVGVP
jgi:hypothetical protein